MTDSDHRHPASQRSGGPRKLPKRARDSPRDHIRNQGLYEQRCDDGEDGEARSESSGNGFSLCSRTEDIEGPGTSADVVGCDAYTTSRARDRGTAFGPGTEFTRPTASSQVGDESRLGTKLARSQSRSCSFSAWDL